MGRAQMKLNDFLVSSFPISGQGTWHWRTQTRNISTFSDNEFEKMYFAKNNSHGDGDATPPYYNYNPNSPHFQRKTSRKLQS